MYTFVHWYKFENDEVERILSCKCTDLCYILEYIYIGQIKKRRRSPVFAFNMQIPDQVECLVWSLRQIFPKLAKLFPTFHFEYPSVLSRFCFEKVKCSDIKFILFKSNDFVNEIIRVRVFFFSGKFMV